MSAAHVPSLGIVAYLVLFGAVGFMFLFFNLLLGRFIRSSNPSDEKSKIYECGEPSIGSSFVQFDLRFYVVALLFIIFDVEVAFFFPWATVFGKSTHLADPRLEVVAQTSAGDLVLTKQAELLYKEFGVAQPVVPDPQQVPEALAQSIDQAASQQEQATQIIRRGAKQLAWLTIADIGVFFAVLMVGFAYVWRRGDLDWVRATTRQRAARMGLEPPGTSAKESVLSA